jgi:hypothetical protein
VVRVEYGWENDVEGYTSKGHATYRNAALALARALLLLEDNCTVRLVPEKTFES